MNPIILLLKTFRGFSSSLRIKARFSLGYKRCGSLVPDHTPLACLGPPATLASFQYHILSEHIPASGPLHLLFPLPGTLFLTVFHDWLLCAIWVPGLTSSPQRSLSQSPCLKKKKPCTIVSCHILYGSLQHFSLNLSRYIFVYLFIVCVSHSSPGWAP